MPQSLPNSEKIKSEMRQSWDQSAAGWQKWWQTFERAAQSVSDRLVELAGIQPGWRVLDVATGIGEPAITAARKVGPAGQVVATDMSAGMLAAARARAIKMGIRNIEFRQADAETISIPERGFNAILCRWGLMFLPNLVSALGRMRELLADGGRMATAVWDKAETVPLINLAGATARKLANLPPPPPDALDPCRLSDPAMLERAFRDAGFKDFHIEPITVTFEFDSPEAFAQYRYEVAAPFRRMVDGVSPEVRQKIIETVAEEARRFVVNGVVRLTNQAFCAGARK